MKQRLIDADEKQRIINQHLIDANRILSPSAPLLLCVYLEQFSQQATTEHG